MKPEVSIPVALATAALVYGIYQAALPSFADTRMAAPDDANLRSSEDNALLLGVAACAGISLISRDATPFIYGGITAVALSWSHRWHRAVNPATGKVADVVSSAMDNNVSKVAA